MRNNDTHLMKLLREVNELIPIKHLEECQHKVKLRNIICIKHCVSTPRGSCISAVDEVMCLPARRPGVLDGVL